MPNLNKTGPQGQGPLTGRGMGDCNTNPNKTAKMGFFRRLGMGMGFGRKFRGR